MHGLGVTPGFELYVKEEEGLTLQELVDHPDLPSLMDQFEQLSESWKQHYVDLELQKIKADFGSGIPPEMISAINQCRTKLEIANLLMDSWNEGYAMITNVSILELAAYIAMSDYRKQIFEVASLLYTVIPTAFTSMSSTGSSTSSTGASVSSVPPRGPDSVRHGATRRNTIHSGDQKKMKLDSEISTRNRITDLMLNYRTLNLRGSVVTDDLLQKLKEFKELSEIFLDIDRFYIPFMTDVQGIIAPSSRYLTRYTYVTEEIPVRSLELMLRV